MSESTSEHGEWIKAEERYEDGCKADGRPHTNLLSQATLPVTDAASERARERFLTEPVVRPRTTEDGDE
jgi:hypothetical protein